MSAKAGAREQAKNATEFTALESALMMYGETFKDQPKVLELISRAAKKQSRM